MDWTVTCLQNGICPSFHYRHVLKKLYYFGKFLELAVFISAPVVGLWESRDGASLYAVCVPHGEVTTSLRDLWTELVELQRSATWNQGCIENSQKPYWLKRTVGAGPVSLLECHSDELTIKAPPPHCKRSRYIHILHSALCYAGSINCGPQFWIMDERGTMSSKILWKSLVLWTSDLYWACDHVITWWSLGL